MGSPAISDFKLDSEGHCFLCLKRTLVKVKQEPDFMESPEFQKHSVHYLARYLQMDMGKVFSEKRQIDSTLLAKVRRSSLKVELCEKCTSLNERFSGLYQQLEKLEIEINSSLGLIQKQLVGTDQSDDDDYLTKSRLNSLTKNEVWQIVDVLRQEAIQKCSKKLRDVSLRVKVKRLTKKTIDAEVLKRRTNSGITKLEPETSSPETFVELEENGKTESEPPYENILSDDDSRSHDMEHSETINDECGTLDGPHASRNDKIRKSKNSLIVISPASKSTSSTGKVKASINPKTGKWKCSACPMEFSSNRGSGYHYENVHQNIRFRCVPCGKEFSNRPNYNTHHRNVHVGVRFKCLACSKLFTSKHGLQGHQRSIDCRKGI